MNDNFPRLDCGGDRHGRQIAACVTVIMFEVTAIAAGQLFAHWLGQIFAFWGAVLWLVFMTMESVRSLKRKGRRP